MHIQIKRFSDNGESTLSILYIDGVFDCFVLEDTYREVKKMHETCIPSGRYKIKFNRNETPMTLKYRKRYPWFNYHLEIQNVPFFTSVYIHVGNTADDSSGCLLLGNTCSSNADRDGFIGESKNAFKDFYAKVSERLEDNEDVYIQITEGFPI